MYLNPQLRRVHKYAYIWIFSTCFCCIGPMPVKNLSEVSMVVKIASGFRGIILTCDTYVCFLSTLASVRMNSVQFWFICVEGVGLSGSSDFVDPMTSVDSSPPQTCTVLESSCRFHWQSREFWTCRLWLDATGLKGREQRVLHTCEN